MRRRPLLWLASAVFLLFLTLPAEVFYEPPQIAEACKARIYGRVVRQEERSGGTCTELADCRIWNDQIRFQTDRILVYFTDPALFQVGEDLSLSGTVYPLEEPGNPGQFNSRLYYEGKRISYRVFAETAEVQKSRPAPVRNAAAGIRRRLAKTYDAVLEEEDAGLLKAMVLGQKADVAAEQKELYQKNGMAHLLAISGLHISLVGTGVYRFLKRLSGSFLASGLLSIFLVAVYGWMTGASVSAVRAVLMCSLLILADVVGRTYDLLEAAGAAALVLLLRDPLSAKQSAFLLSFGAVIAIGLSEPLWRLYGSGKGRVGSAAKTGFSVLFLTLPLLLLFFFEYPLYSIPVNLLVIPLMSILMVCGLFCGISGFFSLALARLFAGVCRLILSGYEELGKRALALPGALLKTGAPGLWKVCVYYVLLTAVFLLLYREKRKKKYWRGKGSFRPSKAAAGISLGLLLSGAALLGVRIHSGVRVVMLDVGQGDAIFFRSPAGTTFLMDGGSTSVKEVGKNRILPFLKHEGVGTLDYVLISHMDQDHRNGILELLEDSRKPGGIRIRYAVLPALSEKEEAFLEMEARCLEAGVSLLYLGRGDRMEEGGLSLTCLWPEAAYSRTDRNALSMVLLMKYREFELLLTGDIGREEEQRLIEQGGPGRIEVLKTAHHGSGHSSDKSFLNQVRPELALISCGAGNRYGHPGEDTLKRLREAGSRVWITRDLGAISLWTDGRVMRAESFRKP